MRSLRTGSGRRCRLTGRLIAALVGHRAGVHSVSRCHPITGALHALWFWERRLRPWCSLTESTITTCTPRATFSVGEGRSWSVVPLVQPAALECKRALIAAVPTINGGQLFVLMLGQIAAAATHRQLAQATFTDLLAQLDSARQALAVFAATPDRTVRAATMASRLTPLLVSGLVTAG